MLEAYFQPIHSNVLGEDNEVLASDAIGNRIQGYFHEGKFPDFENARIAIIGVGEDRGNELNKGADAGMDAIRKNFYKLKLHQHPQKIVDFGNLRRGETIEDTYAAIATVIYELIPLKIIPVILGGSPASVRTAATNRRPRSREMPPDCRAETRGDATGSCRTARRRRRPTAPP